MRPIIINRLWHGTASVRNYIVENAIKRQMDLTIILRDANESMVVPWKKLTMERKILKYLKADMIVGLIR